MRKTLIALAALTIAPMTMAQEPPTDPIREVCQGETLACIVAAVPLSLVAGALVLHAVGEAYDTACGGLVAPGDWGVESTGTRPAYEGQYYCGSLPGRDG